jgi:restriction system protein
MSLQVEPQGAASWRRAGVTGKPSDGGIDGGHQGRQVGFDVVCIQAKRWEGSVGRPVIQQFVGSMMLDHDVGVSGPRSTS